MNLPFYFTIGLFLGSFANVYLIRLPKDLSVIRPRSYCPSCKETIRWYHNVPILSYLYLGGKCAYCHAKVSIQYPLIELFSGILTLTVAYQFKTEPPLIQAGFVSFAYLLFLVGGIDTSTYFEFDKQYGIIPDHLLIILAILGSLFLVINPLFESRIWLAPVSALGGILFLLLFRWGGEAILKREALGLGDVKLIGALGLWIGWNGIMTTLIVGSILGSLVGLILLLSKKLAKGSSLPFGPFLAMGAIISLFWLK